MKETWIKIARDEKISAKAKGLLFIILCHFRNDFTTGDISECVKDGYQSVSKGLSELEQKDVIKREHLFLNGTPRKAWRLVPDKKELEARMNFDELPLDQCIDKVMRDEVWVTNCMRTLKTDVNWVAAALTFKEWVEVWKKDLEASNCLTKKPEPAKKHIYNFIKYKLKSWTEEKKQLKKTPPITAETKQFKASW